MYWIQIIALIFSALQKQYLSIVFLRLFFRMDNQFGAHEINQIGHSSVMCVCVCIWRAISLETTYSYVSNMHAHNWLEIVSLNTGDGNEVQNLFFLRIKIYLLALA